MLTLSESYHFYHIWLGILGYINQKFNIEPDLQPALESRVPQGMPLASVIAIRNKLWENTEIIDEYLEIAGDSIPENDFFILLDWKSKHIRDNFYILKYYKNFTLFLSDGQNKETNLYAVSGIHAHIRKLIPDHELPKLVDAVLLPFAGKIIYDSVLPMYVLQFGPGIKRILKKECRELKQNKGIIKVL